VPLFPNEREFRSPTFSIIASPRGDRQQLLGEETLQLGSVTKRSRPQGLSMPSVETRSVSEDWLASRGGTTDGMVALLADASGYDCQSPTPTPLHVQVPRFQGVLLDELAARLDLVAHQDAEQVVGGPRVVHADLKHRTLGGVQRRVAEFLGVHLA